MVELSVKLMVYFDEEVSFGENGVDFILMSENFFFEDFDGWNFLCFVLFNQENLAVTSFADNSQEGKVINGFLGKLRHGKGKADR